VEDTVPGIPAIDQIQDEEISAKWHNETIVDHKLPHRGGGQAEVPLSST
jgi:hypothetical protein